MALNNDFGLFNVHAPRLEDAGLEDPALPVHAIQEAFKRAADAVQTSPWLLHATAGNTVGSVRTGQEESARSPANDFCEPGNWDRLAALGEKESCVASKSGGRTVEEGHDVVLGPDVVLFESDKVEFGKEGAGPKLGDKGCVEGLDGDRGEDKDTTNETENGPILVLA